MLQTTPCKVCGETESVVAVVTHSNDTKHYCLECQTCGKRNAVKRVVLTPTQIVNAKPASDTLSQEYWKQRQGEWQRERDEKNTEWWRRYNGYLQTPKWRDKRDRVLRRDNYVCKACEHRRATQAHHLTYKHAFDEPLFDLIAICDLCHESLHTMEHDK
jgi:transcription elongation factor Elf1